MEKINPEWAQHKLYYGANKANANTGAIQPVHLINNVAEAVPQEYKVSTSIYTQIFFFLYIFKKSTFYDKPELNSKFNRHYRSSDQIRTHVVPPEWATTKRVTNIYTPKRKTELRKVVVDALEVNFIFIFYA